jgi:hypothetical protein
MMQHSQSKGACGNDPLTRPVLHSWALSYLSERGISLATGQASRLSSLSARDIPELLDLIASPFGSFGHNSKTRRPGFPKRRVLLLFYNPHVLTLPRAGQASGESRTPGGLMSSLVLTRDVGRGFPHAHVSYCSAPASLLPSSTFYTRGGAQ